jgi:hypothetical protein
MLRCRSIASLRRTVSTPPLVDFSRASPLDFFEQPARGFFQHPASSQSKRPSTLYFRLQKHFGCSCGFSASEAAKLTARIRSIIEMLLWYSDPQHVEALLPPVSVLSIPV